MIDDEAIRAAFGALADEAPGPERIRAGLATRIRRERQRRVVLRFAGAGVAAAAVGATGTGVWRLTRPEESTFPEIAGGPGGGWLGVPLRFRPTWLPKGYGQVMRTVVVVGEQAPVVSRDWRTAVANESISLLVGRHESLEADRPRGRTEAVDIDGVPGELVLSDFVGNAVYLTWQPPGQPQLLVAVGSEATLAEQRTTALRVARSVRPDQRQTHVGPRLGGLPDDLAVLPWRVTQGFEGQHWYQQVYILGAGSRELTILMGPDVHKDLPRYPSARQVRVAGLDGHYLPDSRHLMLTLPDGLQLFLGLNPIDPFVDQPPPDEVPAEMVQIIEGLTPGPWPDMRWVGTR